MLPSVHTAQHWSASSERRIKSGLSQPVPIVRPVQILLFHLRPGLLSSLQDFRNKIMHAFFMSSMCATRLAHFIVRHSIIFVLFGEEYKNLCWKQQRSFVRLNSCSLRISRECPPFHLKNIRARPVTGHSQSFPQFFRLIIYYNSYSVRENAYDGNSVVK
jgi:hypothetical protein